MVLLLVLLADGDGDDAVFQLQVIEMIIWSSEKNGPLHVHTYEIHIDHCVCVCVLLIGYQVTTKSAENFTQINLTNRISSSFFFFFFGIVSFGRTLGRLYIRFYACQSGFRIGR